MAVSLTNNPLFLVLVMATVILTVVLRRSDAPWARAIWVYLAVAVVIILTRVIFQIVLGSRGEIVLFRLPQLDLASWAAGITIGGPVMAEGLLHSVYEGLSLAAMLLCVGAANALANPKRALRCVPAALHDVSVAVVISLTVLPQMVQGAIRVKRARRLRGGASHGLFAMRAIAVPVLEDAVERSLSLAAAMEARGYGRGNQVADSSRRLTTILLATSLVLLSLGSYTILGAIGHPAIAIAVLVAGGAAGTAGLAISGRQRATTHYRPDQWRLPEWLVAGAGIATAIGVIVLASIFPTVMQPPFEPIRWPQLNPWMLVVVAVTALPAVVAPTPSRGDHA